MRLVGLTGGIATGKSTVAAMLASHGAAIVDADALAREVVEPGEPAFGEIVATFGPAVVDASGRLDRPRLAAIVFSDPELRARLDAITHPRIADLMSERIDAALARGAALVVADVPLLFENHREAMFEGTLLVYAPQSEQARRLQERDGLDAAAIRSRLDAQMPIEVKRHLATWVIDNSGSKAATSAAVRAWWSAVTGAVA
ncbi:MAG: dephospho-CoA kinase [Candidatus Dormibacteria bacterium]